MKFFAVAVAALAGTAIAAPFKRSVISEVTGVLGGVTANTPVAQLETELKGILGGTLVQVEQALGGIPLAGKLLALIKGGLQPAAAQAIGEVLVLVQSGLPINAANSYLNTVTNGAVTNIEQTLGTSDLVATLTSVTDVAGGVTNVV